MKVISKMSLGKLLFYCVGCKMVHKLTNKWKWNGNNDKPTITPKAMSMTLDVKSGKQVNCKVEIKEGMLIYDNEITNHDLKGHTVPMQDIPVEEPSANKN